MAARHRDEPFLAHGQRLHLVDPVGGGGVCQGEHCAPERCISYPATAHRDRCRLRPLSAWQPIDDLVTAIGQGLCRVDQAISADAAIAEPAGVRHLRDKAEVGARLQTHRRLRSGLKREAMADLLPQLQCCPQERPRLLGSCAEQAEVKILFGVAIAAALGIAEPDRQCSGAREAVVRLLPPLGHALEQLTFFRPQPCHLEIANVAIGEQGADRRLGVPIHSVGRVIRVARHKAELPADDREIQQAEAGLFVDPLTEVQRFSQHAIPCETVGMTPTRRQLHPLPTNR